MFIVQGVDERSPIITNIIKGLSQTKISLKQGEAMIDQGNLILVLEDNKKSFHV